MDAVNCGERPIEDREKVADAYTIAAMGDRWRRENIGKWRTPMPENPSNEVAEFLSTLSWGFSVGERRENGRKIYARFRALIEKEQANDTR